MQPGELIRPLPSWQLKADHTAIAAVKKAEDGNGIILRLVELAGEPEGVTLHVPDAYRAAWQTNLLEENQRPLIRDGNRLSVDMKPWKIVTVRLV